MGSGVHAPGLKLYSPQLPLRNGVSASVVVLPYSTIKSQFSSGEAPSLLQFLQQKFEHVSPAEWLERVQAGLVLAQTGGPNAPVLPITVQTPCSPGLRVYYYRHVAQEPSETPQAPQVGILHQDAHLLVADKPHGMPVTPSGHYVQRSLLVQLKLQTGLQDLAPIHRIDKDTAGLVLFSVLPATRGAYHALFHDRAVRKTYQAIAPWCAELQHPTERHSRIVPAAHFMQMMEVDGTPNSHTHIRMLERLPQPPTGFPAHSLAHNQTQGLALYELQPVSGKRHQLRVHMNALGAPILNDGIYPTLRPQGANDPALPLQLLAKRVGFVDPVTGVVREFESLQNLGSGDRNRTGT